MNCGNLSPPLDRQSSPPFLCSTFDLFLLCTRAALGAKQNLAGSAEPQSLKEKNHGDFGRNDQLKPYERGKRQSRKCQ